MVGLCEDSDVQEILIRTGKYTGTFYRIRTKDIDVRPLLEEKKELKAQIEEWESQLVEIPENVSSEIVEIIEVHNMELQIQIASAEDRIEQINTIIDKLKAIIEA